MVSFLKPYTNYVMKNPYDPIPVLANTETPIKRYLYFLTLKPKTYTISDLYSDSDTNMYLLKNYTKSVNLDTKSNENINAKSSVFTIDQTPENISSVSVKKNNKKLKKDNYNVYRGSSRKDTNLKYRRNLFFSNHILSDWVSNLGYTGDWVKFSDFEVDRQRDFFRNSKHGSKYRLNFNSDF
jgi:hypothetical protein